MQVTVKVLCVGDSGVGKTSLIVRAIDGTFSDSMVSTVGIDFFVRKMVSSQAVQCFLLSEWGGCQVVGGCKARVELWDTAGQVTSL